jgi:hypothetical protein
MLPLPADIFSEPEEVSPDSLANLGPLRRSVTARRGGTTYGICWTDFLEQAFRTDSCRCDLTFNGDGSWSYLIQTALFVRGAPFHHHDSNTLKLVAPPKLNPLAVIVNDRGKANKPA